MKTKCRNKALSFGLVLMLGLSGPLSGCAAPEGSSHQDSSPVSSQESSSAVEESLGTSESSAAPSDSVEITYPVADASTLTWGMSTSSSWNDRYDTFADIPLGKALQEMTGYKLEMVHVENSTAMNLLIAGGELPDIISFSFAGNYSGGEEKALSDGIVMGLDEAFLKENAPDYWAVLNSNPDYLKQAKTPSGPIFGFSFIVGDELLKGGYGLIIRDDWCEELKISIPQTAGEFYNMLKAFKEQKGISYPLCVRSGDLGSMMDRGVITSPFNLVTRDVYVDNGTVKIGYYQAEYKDVLAWLNQLYTEELLDINFTTLDSDTVAANMLTGLAGASAGAAGSILGTWLNTNKDAENYSLMGIKNLVAKQGDTPLYGHYNNDFPGNASVITSDCADPAAAAKFLNFGYTEAGHILYNFGVENESYTFVDGSPVYTDLVLNNPAGLTVKQALSEYQLAYGNGPFVQDKNYLLQYYSTDEQKEALVNWTDNQARNYKLPRITISAANNAEYATLRNDIQTYRDEMTIDFIKGNRSLDEFDSYMSTLKSMGIERLIEIYSEAVAEYNSR